MGDRRTLELGRGLSGASTASDKEFNKAMENFKEATGAFKEAVAAANELNKVKLNSFESSVKRVANTMDALGKNARKTNAFTQVMEEYGKTIKDQSGNITNTGLRNAESKIREEMTSLSQEIQKGVIEINSAFNNTGEIDDQLANALELKIERYGQLADQLLAVNAVIKSSFKTVDELNYFELFEASQEKALKRVQAYSNSVQEFEEDMAQFNPYKNRSSRESLMREYDINVDKSLDYDRQIAEYELLEKEYSRYKKEYMEYAYSGGSTNELDYAYKYSAILEEIQERLSNLRVLEAESKLGKNIIDVEGINRSLRSIDASISRIEQAFRILSSSGGDFSGIVQEFERISEEEIKVADGGEKLSSSFMAIDDDHLDKLYLIIERISELLADMDVNKFKNLFANIGTELDPFISKLGDLEEGIRNIKMDFKMDFGKVATGGKSAASIAAQQGEMRSDLIEEMMAQKRQVEEYITSTYQNMHRFVLGSPFAKGSQALTSANSWLEKFSDKSINELSSNTAKVTRLKQFFSQVQEIGEFWNNKNDFGVQRPKFDFSKFRMDFTEQLDEIAKVGDTTEEAKKKMELVRESMSAVFGGGTNATANFNFDAEGLLQQIETVTQNIEKLYELTDVFGKNGFKGIGNQLVGEAGEFQSLEGAIESVVKAIEGKNSAIEQENQIVQGAVESEINMFDALTGTIILVEERIEHLAGAMSALSSAIESSIAGSIDKIVPVAENEGFIEIKVKPTMSSISDSINIIENKLWTYPFKIEVTPVISNQPRAVSQLQDQLMGNAFDSTDIAKNFFSRFNITDPKVKALMSDSMNNLMSNYLKYGEEGLSGFDDLAKQMVSSVYKYGNVDPSHLMDYGIRNYFSEYEEEVLSFYKKYKGKLNISDAIGDLTKDELSDFKKYFSTNKRSLSVNSLYENFISEFPSIFRSSGLDEIINPAEQIRAIKSIFEKAQSIRATKRLNAGGLLPASMLGENNKLFNEEIYGEVNNTIEQLFSRADSSSGRGTIRVPIEVEIPNSQELFEKLNLQLLELQGILNELDLTKLNELGNLDNFQRLIEILSGFKNIKNVEGLSNSLNALGEALMKFNESTANLNAENITFLDELNKLAANGDSLKYLAQVLKASQSQINKAKKAAGEVAKENEKTSEFQAPVVSEKGELVSVTEDANTALAAQTNINDSLTESSEKNAEAMKDQSTAMEAITESLEKQSEASDRAADSSARGAEKQVEAYREMEQAQREVLENDLELTRRSEQRELLGRGKSVTTKEVTEYASADNVKSAKFTTLYTEDEDGNPLTVNTLDMSQDVKLERKLAEQAKAQERSVALLRENNRAIANGALKEFNAEENEAVTSAIGKLDNATVNAKTGIATLTFRKEGESVEVFKVQVKDLSDALLQLKQSAEGVTTGTEILQTLGAVSANGSVVSRTSISRSALSRSIDEKWAGKSATMSKNLGKFLLKYRGNEEIEGLKEFQVLNERWDSLNAKGIAENLGVNKEDINDENYSGFISRFEQETERLRKALTDRIKVLEQAKSEAARVAGIDSDLFNLISAAGDGRFSEYGTLKSVMTNENGVTTLKFAIDDGNTIKTTTIRLTELESILEKTEDGAYKLRENLNLREEAGSGFSVSSVLKPGEKIISGGEARINKLTNDLGDYKLMTQNLEGFTGAIEQAESILENMGKAKSRAEISSLAAQFDQAVAPIKAVSSELKMFAEYSGSNGVVEKFGENIEKAQGVLEKMAATKDKVELGKLKKEFEEIVEPIKKAMKAFEDFSLVREKINAKLESLAEKYAADLGKLEEGDPILRRLNKMLEDTGNITWQGNGSTVRTSIDLLKSDFAELRTDIEGLSKGKYSGVIKEIQNLFASLGGAKVDLSPLISALKEVGINLEDYDNNVYKAIERNAELSKSFEKVGSEEVSRMIKEAKTALSTFTTKAASDNGLSAEGESFRLKLLQIIESLEKLKAELNSGTRSSTLEQLTEQAGELQAQLTGVGASIGGRGSNYFTMARGDKVTGLSNKLSKWRSTNSKAMNNQGVADWYNSIVAGYNASDKTVANVEKFNSSLNRLDTAVNEAGLNGLSLMDTLKRRARGFVGWMSIYLNAFTIIHKVKEGIETVKELDTAFVEMQKVSNDTYSSLENYKNISFDLGDTVGTTGLQMQKSAADWMRLGENIEQAKESAAISNELLNISEFEDINSATESLVAVSQAYRDLDKIDIVDKLNNIGNNFSISTDQLAEGLQRASATLLTQGNDINEAIALITAGNNTIQNSLMVAAGIKTISLRIAGTKEGEEKLAAEGEDTSDYVVTTVSKKRGIIKDYTAVASNKYQGVDILDANGNYKSTFEILKEISEVYQEIQEEDKKFGTNRAAALIEELAGKNRSNIAAAILQNGELLQKVYDYSIDSQGSAQEELDKYLDSIQGKTTQLQNKAQEFASIVIPTDMFKGVLDGANALLDVVNKILSATGGIPGVLGALVGGTLGTTGHDVISFVNYLKTMSSSSSRYANVPGQVPVGSSGMFSAFPNIFGGIKSALFDQRANVSMNVADYFSRQGLLNNNVQYSVAQWRETADIIGDMNFTRFINGLDLADDAMITGTEAMEGYKASLISLNQTTSLVGAALSSLGAIAKSLIATFATIAVSMAVFALIGKAWSYIDENVIHRVENLKEAGEKAQTTFDSLAKSFNNSSTKIAELASQYGDDTEKEFKRTEDAVDSLAERYAELKDGVSIDGENVSLSSSEYEEFLNINNQIADLFPSLVSGYDAEGNAILTLGNNAETAAQQLNTLLEKEKERNAAEMVEQMNTSFVGQMADYEELSDVLDKQLRDAKIVKSANVDSSIEELIDQSTGEAVKVADLEGKKLVELSDGLLKSYISQFANIEEKYIDDAMLARYKSYFTTYGTTFGKTNTEAEQKMDSLFRDAATTEAKQEDILNAVANNISSVLPSKKGFSDLDTILQTIISSNVKSFIDDYGAAGLQANYINQGKTLDDFVYDNIIYPLKDERFTKEIQDELTNLLEKGYNDKSLPEYASKFQSILSKAFDVGSEDYNNMAKLFGMKDKIRNYVSGLRKAEGKVKDFKKHAGDLATLSQKDFGIMVNLIDDGFQGSYKELMHEIDEANKKKIEIDVTPLDIDELLADEDSAVNRVLNAFGSDAKEKGDTYAQILTYIDEMETLYKNGDIGTEKFKSLAAFFSPTGSDDIDNYMENLSKINRYFTKDSTDGIYNFMDDLVKTLSESGYEEAMIKDGMYHLPAFFDADKIGRKMGISGEALTTLLGEAMDKGLSNDFFTDAESGMDTIIGLQEDLVDAQLRLNQLRKNDPNNKTAIEAQEEKIKSLTERIKEAKTGLEDFFNYQKRDKKKTFEEDVKDIDQAIKDYKNLDKDYSKDRKTNKLWEERKKDYEYSIIKSGQEAGLSTGYNNRGQLVADTDASNKRLEKNADLVDAYKKNGKVTKELSEAMAKYNLSSKKESDIQKFLDTYDREKWLDVEEVAKMNEDVFATETEKQTSELIEAIQSIAPDLAELIGPYLDPNYGKEDVGENTGVTNGENPKNETPSKPKWQKSKEEVQADKPTSEGQDKKTGFLSTVGKFLDGTLLREFINGLFDWDPVVEVDAAELPEGYVFREKNKDFNFTDRPKVDYTTMWDKGWDTEEGSYSTVDTIGYTDENGKEYVVTPILPDGTVLNKKDLKDYIDKVMAGGEDYNNLVISTFEGENARKASEDYAEALHEVHAAYYSTDKVLQDSVHSLEDYTAAELRAIDLTDDSTSEMEDAFVGLMESLGLTNDQADQLINVLADMGLLRIRPQIDLSGITSVDQLNDTLSGSLEVGQSVTYTANVEDAESTVTATEEEEGVITYTAEVDGVIKELEPVEERDGTITYHFKTDGDNSDKNDNTNKDGGTITTETDLNTDGFEKGKVDVEHGVNALSKETATPNVSLQGAINANTQLRNLESTMNRLDGKKSKVTLTTVKETIVKGGGSQGNQGGNKRTTQYNGTFHLARAFASGSNVSLGNNETALINELGKEIVVRNGKAMSFNNGYPTFAKLKRGDIVFNHKQTEELEKNGYVTGSHAKIYGGDSAFAEGTFISNAYPTGMYTKKAYKKKIKDSNDGKKDDGKGKKGGDDKKKKKKNDNSAWKKFEENLGKLFDWVEVRLDNLARKTEKWTDLFENFLNAASANAQNAYNAAISASQKQQTYTTTASSKYLRQAIQVGLNGADKAGKKITRSWAMSMYRKLLNDDLNEQDIKKYNDKQRTIIDSMKDYIDKARDAADSTVELTNSINDLIKAQRDAKVEFRQNAYSTIVEKTNRFTAGSKNSGLAAENAMFEYNNKVYNDALQSEYSQLSRLSKSGINQSKASTGTNKKVLKALKGKDKETYKKNLKKAASYIKAKKAIPSSLINYFEKRNPSLSAKYLAWNYQLSNLENARIETAMNYAESMSGIISNVAEKYQNLDEETQNKISLAQAKADNASDYKAANKMLDKIDSYQDEILKNDRAELADYSKKMNTYRPSITSGSYKGNQYKNASSKTQKAVNTVRNNAIKAVNSNKPISDSDMTKLYDYFSKGYVSQAFFEACIAWNAARYGAEEAANQLMIDEETAKQEKLNNFSSKISNIETHYSNRVSEIEARKASRYGSYDDSKTQSKIIDERKNEIKAYEDALQSAMDAGIIEKGDKAWYEYTLKIQDAKNEVLELENTRFETVLAEKFDRAIEKAQEFIDKLETINDLISDEMLIDEKSGQLTDFGWMSVGLNSQAMAKEQNNLEKYLAKRQEILEAYADGNNDYFGDQSFDEMINENADDILSAISNINSYREALLDLIEKQKDAELEALQKVIDKRKEALSRKKEYYDYDKTIKGKTKDLQALEQQIRALEGVAGQEAAAKRANLMAQRKEAQEDLDETVKEHVYNLQVEGLDDMMNDLQEDLDEWKKELRSNIEKQTEAIESFRNSVVGNDSASNIASLLTGISGVVITTEGLKSILEDASKTMSTNLEVIVNVDKDGNVTTSTNEGNVDTGTGDNSTFDMSGNPAPAGTSGSSIQETINQSNNNNQVKQTTTTKKTTTTTTTKKQTVTGANAKKAFEYIFNGKSLKYSSKQGENWGKLNKTLWHHPTKNDSTNRRVYLPKANQIAAWKKLGFNEKNFTTDKLFEALKKTGIWPEMLKVRTDSNKKIWLNSPRLDHVHGYASGGTVHRSGHYLTDEKGEEIIVTKQGILRPLSAGTSVIPADITERLYAIASNYDMNSRAKARSIDLSKIQRIGGETISPIINCPITIEGNANEQDVINAINKTLPKISKHVQNDIRKDLRKSGR